MKKEKTEESAAANGLHLPRHHQQAHLRLRLCNMGAQAQVGRLVSSMKGLGLAILWLARVAEVGLKNSSLQAPKSYHAPVNQTCHCSCSCIHSNLAFEKFPTESFAGTLLALVLWKLVSATVPEATEQALSPCQPGQRLAVWHNDDSVYQKAAGEYLGHFLVVPPHPRRRDGGHLEPPEDFGVPEAEDGKIWLCYSPSADVEFGS